MSPLSRTFWLGAGLIVLTNAVVLGGVAYNRSGEPQSWLQVSERELQVERSRWMEDGENSGLVLHLEHQVADGWVTAEKLQALGFAVWREGELETWSERKEIDALVVLELDGPAYQTAYAAAQAELEQAKKTAQLLPQDSHAQSLLEAAQYEVDRFTTTATRLYVVDAGTDASALRQRYPDRTRYALSRAHLRYYVRYSPQSADKSDYELWVEPVDINVPSPYRAAFEGWSWRGRGEVAVNKVRLDLAFGQRFEPWIIAAERVQ